MLAARLPAGGRVRAGLLLAPMLVLWTPAAPSLVRAQHEVEVVLVDPAADHVHSPGMPLRIQVTLGDWGLSEASVFAVWVDAEGKRLAPPTLLASGTHSLLAPEDAVGYCGLRFQSDDERVAFPPQAAGFASTEYGFAILAPKARRAAEPRPGSFFGTVHTNLADPYLHGGSKTLTWNTARPDAWVTRMRAIRAAGLTELPLVLGEGWDSDDDRPIPAARLERMSRRFREYLLADRTVTDWELGLEENGGDTYEAPFYFHNLAAKARALRVVADEIQPGIRFVYNVRGFDYDELEDLFASGAMEPFQVFAIHPYRWKEFPSPETWLANHIRWVRAILQRHGAGAMPLWITEFGLPVRGNNDPAGFFGYPSSGREVPGVTRDYAARYLVKAHAIAAHAGIGKLFVYNYQNRGDSIDYAEDHFGLRAYTADRRRSPGHPLPSYVAYATMIEHLADKRPPRRRRPRGSVRVYDYAGSAADCILAWVFPDGEQVLTLEELRPGLTAGNVLSARDLYGAPFELSGESVTLSGKPVYLTIAREH